jgi:L-threonylcarbamoyladenylate synthase
MSTLIRTDPGARPVCSSRALLAAARILRDGGLVVFPTDTCYGLVASAGNREAVARLNQLKGRAPHTPLAVLIARPRELWSWGRRTALAGLLARRFLPGPLTLVLESLSPSGTRHLSRDTTIGVRVPDHPLARVLCSLVPPGLAATSANPTGLPSPSSAGPARSAWGAVDDLLILDAGPLPEARASTVVDARYDAPRLIREGAVSQDVLERSITGA